jgi:hypothetical protein
MGKSFKRRWNKARIQKLKALRNPVDDLLTAGAAAAATVKEIVQTLSEPEAEVEITAAVEETIITPTTTPTPTTPKRRRRRASKKTTTVK